jgi:DNA ligase-1
MMPMPPLKTPSASALAARSKALAEMPAPMNTRVTTQHPKDVHPAPSHCFSERFKPQLSPNDDPMKNPNFFAMLQYPLYGSYKLDGIRMVTRAGGCMSRSNKALPNLALQRAYSGFPGYDGEIVIGQPTDADVYNRTQSLIMSIERSLVRATYYTFDIVDMDLAHLPFEDRLQILRQRVAAYNANRPEGGPNIEVLEQVLIQNYEELCAFEAEALEMGYEGIMLRSLDAPYKHGRGTMKQCIIVKLKRFRDEEALLVGFEEQMHNTNASFVNETGGTSRSKVASGLIPANTLGKLLVSFQGEIMPVSCGVMPHSERKAIWDSREAHLRRTLKFRHFPHGAKDLPRFPRFVGWRTEIDL